MTARTGHYPADRRTSGATTTRGLGKPNRGSGLRDD